MIHSQASHYNVSISDLQANLISDLLAEIEPYNRLSDDQTREKQAQATLQAELHKLMDGDEESLEEEDVPSLQANTRQHHQPGVPTQGGSFW